jgi:hypothetical protein
VNSGNLFLVAINCITDQFAEDVESQEHDAKDLEDFLKILVLIIEIYWNRKYRVVPLNLSTFLHRPKTWQSHAKY